MTVARLPRVRASPLVGRRWLNTGGADLTLADLRGKVVVLDFWTSCCVNCLHVLDELRDLEERMRDVLVVVGVHSPKFAHEGEAEAVEAAVERYAVHHPVLDDPELRTWDAYTARAWPTLVVVDPVGYVVAHLAGEGHAHGLEVLARELVAEHEASGTLRRGDGPYVVPPPAPTALRFPGGLQPLPGGGVLVSDTAHHQLVELDDDLVTERRRIGTGARGFEDGAAAVASFAEPQGITLLPDDVARRLGADVAVADSVNHAVRGVRLADGRVTTLAGTGRPLRRLVTEGGPALAQELSTPWDVAWFGDRLLVAMAGVHQLWACDPAAGGRGGYVAPVVGQGTEGLLDGTGLEAWLAQPSGLATSPDGQVLWVADAETSAVRAVRRTGSGPATTYAVTTAVGEGLFDFGHVDGPAATARLQHPLALTALPDGSVAVADTYNGAVRLVDTRDGGTGEVGTLAADLAEPTAVAVVTAGGVVQLVVAESTAHRLTRVAVPARVARVDGGASRTRRTPADLPAGEVVLEVAFTPPTGQRLDDREGDPTRLAVSASPPELLAEGAGSGPGLTRRLVVDPDAGAGVLHVTAHAAACDAGGPGTEPEHAACHLYQQDWGIPVRVVDGAPALLRLDLRGV